MLFHRLTERVYYSRPDDTTCDARVVRVGPDYIEFDRTVAYPEGGGQEADKGVIELENGVSIPFFWAKKMYTSPAGIPGFSDVKVGGVIWHLVQETEQPLLASIREGMRARISIDPERRHLLSLYHTASHLLYAAIEAVRPGSTAHTLGCHIKTDGARFDLGVPERFHEADLHQMAEIANQLVEEARSIQIVPHPDMPDARTWICGELRIPCGGTHVDNTSWVGPLLVRRRGLGAGKERLSCQLTEVKVDATARRAASLAEERS